MIDYVRITGFQSLEDVRLSLGRFTVLVGPSNSGKSAIRRALEAMTTNAPATGRLRTGSETMSVEVATEAGRVTWHKGTKRNAYTVETDAGSVAQDKPGASATPEVLAVLGLDEANFSDQFDRPYLLGESPGAVAKALGELTNITVLFDAQREATRQQRDADQQAKTIQTQRDTAQASLATFWDLPATDARLRTAAESLAAAGEANKAADRLHHDVMLAEAQRDNVAAMDRRLAELPTLDPNPLPRAEHLATQAQALTRDLGHARYYQAEAAQELPPAPTVPDGLEDAVRDAQALQSAMLHALGHAGNVANWSDQAAALEVAETEARAQLATFDTCPLCGTPGIHLEAS